VLQPELRSAVADNHHSPAIVVAQEIPQEALHSQCGLFETLSVRKGFCNMVSEGHSDFGSRASAKVSVITFAQPGILHYRQCSTGKSDFGCPVGALKVRAKDRVKGDILMTLPKLACLADSPR